MIGELPLVKQRIDIYQSFVAYLILGASLWTYLFIFGFQLQVIPP